MDNIVLIGMPGAGKSTIGKRLAKEIGFEFLDSDDIITNHTGEPLEATFERVGYEKFLDIEKDAVLSIDVHKTVIATGGSVILRGEAMEHLKKIGTIVYLRLPFCAIDRRINNFETRGIARREHESLRDIYNMRTPIYEENCNIKINCNKKTVARIVDMIVEAVGAKNIGSK